MQYIHYIWSLCGPVAPYGPFLAVLRKIKLSQSVLLTCLLSLLLRPPLSVVLVVHPHLVSGSGQDHLVVVLAGVGDGCNSSHSVIMKNHSDCEGSLLVKISSWIEEPLVKLASTAHLSSLISCSVKIHQY